MACSASMDANDIGCFFVNKYYDVLRKAPQLAQCLYSERCLVVRVDADSTETATKMSSVNDLLLSFEYGEVVIEAIHCAESEKFTGLVIVELTGWMEIKKVNSEGVSIDLRKKFTQTLALAPRGKACFIAADMLHYLDEEAMAPNVVEVADEV